jgi:hypothetical protein
MGFDPLSIKFIRMAHDLGLGCGDPREIEIVGDLSAASENWHFVGPFKKMTFASRMQHKIYWGPMKRPIEWSLKTVLAPWAYIASVLYHDSFWYPMYAKRIMRQALGSVWGRLFRNWESVTADENGYQDVGPDQGRIRKTGMRALLQKIAARPSTPQLGARAWLLLGSELRDDGDRRAAVAAYQNAYGLTPAPSPFGVMARRYLEMLGSAPEPELKAAVASGGVRLLYPHRTVLAGEVEVTAAAPAATSRGRSRR